MPAKPGAGSGCGTINHTQSAGTECKQGLGQLNIGHEMPVVKKPGVRFWRLIRTTVASESETDDCSGLPCGIKKRTLADYAESASWREPARSPGEQPVGFGAMVGVSSRAGKERKVGGEEACCADAAG